MPIARENKSDYKPVPSGTHPARCFGVVALGTQVPANQTYRPTNKVMLIWELPHELYEVDGKEVPMTISKRYTLSLNKKATLRKDLDSWRSKGFTEDEAKGFPVENVISAPCFLSITHNPKPPGQDGVFVNIASVTGIPKGTTVPELKHKPVHYELEMGKNAVYESLPEWIREVIGKCLEWNPTESQSVGKPAAMEEESPVDDSDVPF